MRTVWQRLLDRLAAGDRTICADSIRDWDQRQWREALELGLLRDMELASVVLCDQCGEAHWSEVHWDTPGVKACFGCATEGVVDIDIDRLRQWRIDPDRIACLAASALGLTAGACAPLRERLWHLGRCRIAGRFREIYFGLGAGSPVSEMSAAIRASIGQGPALVLTVGCAGGPDGLPASHCVFDFASVSRVERGKITVDMEFLEERLTGDAALPRGASRPHAIPAPVGTTWSDVSIIVFDGFLQVAIAGCEYERTWDEFGVDANSQPAVLLRLFAVARGAMDAARLAAAAEGDSPIKVRVARLRDLLGAMMAIDGNPITYAQKARMYVCQFAVRLAADAGIRAPAGTSWLDLSFHERADGRILVSVPEKELYRAHGGQRRDGLASSEVAETGGTITRTHSLEEMGLRSPTGKITPQGTVFVELLRAGGTLASGHDNLVVLQLAKELREWTGLDGEPLRLVDSSRSWSAIFTCSSELRRSKK